MPDRIEKAIILKAPIARVWKPFADHEEFGRWFQVTLDDPFVPGRTSRGHVTSPGYEHLTWEVVVRTMEPERIFSFTWDPYAVDIDMNHADEAPTPVEFMLEETESGTVPRVVESGFDQRPKERRDPAFRMNEGGWTIQCRNIADHVENDS